MSPKSFAGPLVGAVAVAFLALAPISAFAASRAYLAVSQSGSAPSAASATTAIAAGSTYYVGGCGFDANKPVYMHKVAPLVEVQLTATADAKGCFADLADDAGSPGTYYLDAYQFRNGNSGNYFLAAQTSFTVQ